MKLHEQRDHLTSQLTEAREWMQHMREYLHGPKFSGEGNDYINRDEMLRHLANLRELISD